MSTINLSDEMKGEFSTSNLKSLLECLFRESKPYLRQGYNLRELSDNLGVPLYRISALINQEYAMRFTDFVNLYRIGHAILLIDQGDAFHWSLDGLATNCGFSNRNSFRDAFKRFMGQTPSEYLKERETLDLPASYLKAG